MRPALMTFQVDPAARLDRCDVTWRAVIQSHREAHQCQVSGHRLAPMPRPDHREARPLFHVPSLQFIVPSNLAFNNAFRLADRLAKLVDSQAGPAEDARAYPTAGVGVVSQVWGVQNAAGHRPRQGLAVDQWIRRAWRSKFAYSRECNLRFLHKFLAVRLNPR